MSEKKLFLLDAYALAYRSFYAFIKNPRINSKGENTSATFGFVNTLLEIIKKQKPTHIGVVFDPKGTTFRHDMFKEYKANRQAMPDDLRQSIPHIKEIITAFNIPVIEVEKFEADDVIGTLARKASQLDFLVYMMTPDKDYAQLVTDNVFVYKPARSGNEAEIWNPEKVLEKFKVTPNKIIDLLGLMGDSADNIPGCPGVGPKGAEKLITDFGSIEGVYENIDQLKGKQKENMINFKEQILLSKVLATIEQNVPVNFNENEYILNEPNKEKVTNLFERLEFRNILNRALGSDVVPTYKTKNTVPIQGSLFDAPAEQFVEEPSELKNILTEKPNYILVDTIEAHKKLADLLISQKEICFDTETTSLTLHSAELVGMSFAIKKAEAYYVPFTSNYEETIKILSTFKNVFENKDILKIGQNIKYDIQVLKNYNIIVEGEYFDTMIAHYLIQPEQRHNLDILAKIYLNYKTITTEELIGKKGKNQLSMRSVPITDITNYACEDADITIQLAFILRTELEKYKMTALYKSTEIPLINILADMEYQGVKLDIDSLNEYALVLRDEIILLETSIYKHANTEFNIASPKQLGEILFDNMKIVDKPKLTKTKQYSTGEEVLAKLTDKHPIINDILQYRTLKKLLTTYVEALPQLIHSKTEKIHTSYNQTVTSTGRLSSTNPNLQNIPIRDKRGRKIREAFVPSSENHVLLAADYSQVELRLMAHLCQDENMIQAFADGLDIHTATAAKIFKTDTTNVTREQRSNAKGANFGIIYGISSFGLAENLRIPRKEAKAIIDSYFDNYPKVKSFMDESVQSVRQKGYAETIFGRRRYLPDIEASNAIIRGAAERNAINAPIQGAAADLIKVAMINVYKKLKEGNYQTKMILQVHDELVFDVYKPELEKLKTMVVEQMQNAADLSVPLTVDFGVGDNWLEAH